MDAMDWIGLRCASCDFCRQRFADLSSTDLGSPGNTAEQCARGVMGADDKLHQRAKTPNRRCTQKVQSGHGRFEPLSESRISSEAIDGLCQFRWKEVVLGNIHSVSRA